MYVTMKQPLSGTQFFKTQFADYVFDTPGILKQGHQSWYELVDPKQGSNHTKFERSCFKCPTILIFFFLSNKQMSNISLEWHIHDLVDVISMHTKFHLNQIRTLNFQLKLLDTAVTLKYAQGH